MIDKSTARSSMEMKPVGPAPENTHVAVRFSPRSVLFTLIVLILLLYLASTLVHVARLAGGYPIRDHLVRLFDLDWENNLPTWLSSTNLLICAVLLALIAKANWTRRNAYALSWVGLCFVFFYLAVDEAASLHEVTISPVGEWLGARGAFYSAWIVPAMIVLAVFLLLYLRFLFALPRRIQALFVLAGGLYVVGGIGLEMLSWHYRFPLYDPEDAEASRDLTYLMITHVEELLEMLGVAVFIYALLSYVGMNSITTLISVSPAGRNA